MCGSMRKLRKNVSSDAFTVLCIIQTAAVIIAAVIMFAVSRLSPTYFNELQNDIAGIFEKNYDIGGYFTPTEEKEYSALKTVSYSEDREKTDFLVTLLPSDSFVGEESVSAVPLEMSGTSVAVMPVSGTVTSRYGERIHPIYGEESFHSGTDIAAEEGSPVYAVLDGIVVAAGTAEKAGNYVKIDHGDSLVTLYCHCCEVYVENGDVVRQGEIIAGVGQTGLATGPHLHFEVYKDSEISDPAIILDGAKDAD